MSSSRRRGHLGVRRERARAVAPRSVALGMGALGILVASGCLLPDYGIRLRQEGDNLAPVRIVEPAETTAALRCACDPEACAAAMDMSQDSGGDGVEITPECPLPPASGVPHLLDPNEYPFCICPAGQTDSLALVGFELFVEDQDEDDTLYAAILLDAAEATSPPLAVAYETYLNPGVPLQRVDGLYVPLERPSPVLRRIFIGDVNGRIDLCNGEILSPGLHVATLLATDRPWFSTPLPSDPDAPLIVQVGVPDLASGATYDTVDYVFSCVDVNEDPACSTRCQEATP